MQLLAVTDVTEMRALLDSDEYLFRFDAGVLDTSSKLELCDCSRIVQSLATFFRLCG